MAENPLGGLGSLLGGGVGKVLSSILPQDAPEAKLLKATGELKDLQKQEAELLVEIGRQAFEKNSEGWPQTDKLRLVQENIAAAQQTLDDATRELEAADAAREADDAAGRCPQCGFKNPEDVKFCQECGGRLGAAFCTGCGAALAAGTRFCGECGASTEG